MTALLMGAWVRSVQVVKASLLQPPLSPCSHPHTPQGTPPQTLNPEPQTLKPVRLRRR